MGGKAWNNLHRLVYLIAVLGVVHYWWLVKRDITWPVIYGAILALLFFARIGFSVARRVRRHEKVR